MPRRVHPQGLHTHPMLKKIIDAILEGKQSDRDICKWVTPVVSYGAIYRYRRQVVEPSMQNADKLNAVLSLHNEEKTAVANSYNDAELLEQKPTEQAEQLVRTALLSAPVLAIRENRIKAMQDRHNRLQLIVEERAASPLFADAPGGKSGLLGLDYKGKNGDLEVFKVDTGLLSEFREHEKQIAQELGQWNEGNTTNLAIQIVLPGDNAQIPKAFDFDITATK